MARTTKNLITAEDIHAVLAKDTKLAKTLNKRMAHCSPLIKRNPKSGRTTRKSVGQLLKEVMLGNAKFQMPSAHIDWEAESFKFLVEYRTQRAVSRLFRRIGGPSR